MPLKPRSFLPLLLAIAAGGTAPIAMEACVALSGDCRDHQCVPSAGAVVGAGGGATSSSTGGSGGAGGAGGAPSCPGEAPGCVNEWIAAGVLTEIGGIAGYKDSLYVAANKAIYRVPFATAKPEPIAGSPGISGWSDGSGANARFGAIAGIAIDEQLGRLYLVDIGNCALRYVDLDSNETHALVPNTGNQPMCVAANYADGPATMATLRSPFGIALDAASPHVFAYFTDASAVRRVDLSNLPIAATQTLAGGQMANASFMEPKGLVALVSAIIVTDSNYPGLKGVNPNGNAVSAACGGSADGTMDGSCATATFGIPAAFALNSTPSPALLYLTDFEHNNIRAITTADSVLETVSTLAGGAAGHAVGIGAKAGINGPSFLYYRAATPAELYIVENYSQIRRMVLP